MPLLRTSIAVAVITVAAASSTAGAQAETFFANMTTSQEPSVSLLNLPRSPFGTATFILNDARTRLSMVASVTGIDFTGSQTVATGDNLTAAHIHVFPFPPPPLTLTAPVRWGFFGAPMNDLNPTAGGNCVAFLIGVGGTCTATWDLGEGNSTTLGAQLPALLSNLGYVNFHTVENPGGEIRGQMNVVPEPASVLLLGGGLLGIGSLLFRRRRNG